MKLIAINTIGLTGAEILCAELARHPEIKMLPGQNFIRFKNSVYRPHDYSGMSADEVFEMLSMHQYTRGGRIWAGLTKSMSEEARASYSPEKHRAAFVSAFDRVDFVSLVSLYIQSYHESQGEDISSAPYGGWFGGNIVIHASSYPGMAEEAMIIDFTNPIEFWLASINQRFTWNNLETMKFWIVNQLMILNYALHRKNFLSIDVRDYVSDRAAISRKIRTFLGLAENNNLPEHAPDGFIRYESRFTEKIEKDAATLVPIYKDHALYKLAITMSDWAELFLQDPRHLALLEKYREFWNGTSHTNLDWVGPVAQEIVERALDHTGFKTERNVNCWFYHECFEMDFDHYHAPVSKLQHYLGPLEDEIVLPPLIYYAQIAACYLESVVANCLRRPDSAFPIRETSIYRRLMHPDYTRNFTLWVMTERIHALERSIDETEKRMSFYYPVKGKSKDKSGNPPG